MRVFGFAVLAAWVGLSGTPARGQSQTIFSENFEAGAPGWTFANGTSGLWRLANDGSCGSITVMPAYNRIASCTYNTGGPNNGEMISPPIPMSGQGPFYISFNSMREMDSAADTACIRIRTVGNPTWSNLFCTLENTGIYAPGDLEIPAIYDSTTIELSFRVTANAIGNNKLGWLFDNVAIRNSGPALEPLIATVSPGFGPNSGTSGISISGVNFMGTTAVMIGSTPASFVVNSNTHITASFGATGELGHSDVSVTTFWGTTTATNAFDFFVEPISIGTACEEPFLSWSGSPTIGKSYSVTTQHLGFHSQILLVNFSNEPLQGLFQPALWTSYGSNSCPIYVKPSARIRLGGLLSQTFDIPNDVGLIGTKVRTQAIIRILAGRVAATQAIEATIGE